MVVVESDSWNQPMCSLFCSTRYQLSMVAGMGTRSSTLGSCAEMRPADRDTARSTATRRMIPPRRDFRRGVGGPACAGLGNLTSPLSLSADLPQVAWELHELYADFPASQTFCNSRTGAKLPACMILLVDHYDSF